MKFPYAIPIGLLAAVVDIMPVLGTGLVLLPWAVVAAIMGSFPIAIGGIVLYIIMTVGRNTVEPKLVGQQIGLHPLANLILSAMAFCHILLGGQRNLKSRN